jgi:hypothetical protein
MRLPKTFDGVMPESMTATPTPVPFGLFDDDVVGIPSALRRVAPDGATVTCASVSASLEIERMLGLCASPSSAFLGISQVAASMSGCSDLTPEPRTLQARDRGAAGARAHAHDDALFVRPFPAIVPVLDGRVEGRGLRALPLPRHGRGRCRDREDQSQHGGESDDGATQLDHACWDSRVAANSPRAANSLIWSGLQLRAGNYRTVVVFRMEHADRCQIGVTAGGLEC